VALPDSPSRRLTRAATLLARRIVRHSDVVAWLGPSSFGVVANASGEGARVLAESVASGLEALDLLHDGEPVPVEVCFGMSCLEEAKSAREMLEEARAALQLHVSAAGILGHS